ncbi:MAG: phosphatidylglycerophosphatase A [Granulosicoccus sp.]
MQAVPVKALFASVANFFALGMGLGLAPKAPGTFGTLLGIPVLLLMPINFWMYVGALVVLYLFGVWVCNECSKYLGVHDHGAIVWDEVVGYLVTMIALPLTWQWMLAGFLVFRLFDIVKPWPISWVDRHVHGGSGIMIDDVLAGIFAAATLHTAYWLL